MEETKMQSSSKITVLVALIALVIGGIIGYYYAAPSQTKLSQLQALVNEAYPPPPEEIFSLGGEITSVEGNTISLEVLNPNAYLPTDEPETQIRQVQASDQTQILLIDFSQINEDGDFPQTEMQLSDLQVGDFVTVTAEENIKDKMSFTASSIEVEQEITDEEPEEDVE